MHERRQHMKLTLGKLPSKGRHSVAAFGYLLENFGFGFELEFTGTQARHDLSVIESLTVGFRSVADRTILTKDRGFVILAVSDD